MRFVDFGQVESTIHSSPLGFAMRLRHQQTDMAHEQGNIWLFLSKANIVRYFFCYSL